MKNMISIKRTDSTLTVKGDTKALNRLEDAIDTEFLDYKLERKTSEDKLYLFTYLADNYDTVVDSQAFTSIKALKEYVEGKKYIDNEEDLKAFISDGSFEEDNVRCFFTVGTVNPTV